MAGYPYTGCFLFSRQSIDKLVFCVTLILLFIVISGEATAVMKFLIGRSFQSKISYPGKAGSKRHLLW